MELRTVVRHTIRQNSTFTFMNSYGIIWLTGKVLYELLLGIIDWKSWLLFEHRTDRSIQDIKRLFLDVQRFICVGFANVSFSSQEICTQATFQVLFPFKFWFRAGHVLNNRDELKIAILFVVPRWTTKWTSRAWKNVTFLLWENFMGFIFGRGLRSRKSYVLPRCLM